MTKIGQGRSKCGTGVQWIEHRTDESILLELDLKRDLMAQVAQMKLQYFGHVVRGIAGELALFVMEREMEGTMH